MVVVVDIGPITSRPANRTNITPSAERQKKKRALREMASRPCAAASVGRLRGTPRAVEGACARRAAGSSG
eukprot:5256892-Pyramimonas_sp.AAC.1